MAFGGDRRIPGGEPQEGGHHLGRAGVFLVWDLDGTIAAGTRDEPPDHGGAGDRLEPDRAKPLLRFCREMAGAYADALATEVPERG